MEPRKFAQYIEQLVALSPQQRAALANVLLRGVRPQDIGALIETARAPHLACPRCHKVHLHRHGHANGLQRYRCADCARTFTR